MCEFCESKRAKQIMRYDNRENMSVSCGQYQGVKVDSAVKMQGNMLLLSGWGSYRSNYACYYDSEGLDIDDERGAISNDSYIKIEYCPFCGRKLTSTIYEQTKAKDDIYNLKRKLEYLEADLEKEQLFIYFTWDNKGSIYDDDGTLNWEKTRMNPNYEKREYDNESNVLTLPELYNYYENIEVKIYYGSENLKDYVHYGKYREYNLNSKIFYCQYSCGTFYSCGYSLSEHLYNQLIKLGYIKKNNDKLNKLHETQSQIKEKIKQVKLEISNLNKYIKELKSK